MKRWKRHLALLMLAVMGVQLLPVVGFAQPNSSPTLNENGLTADVEDGAILHTWCWSYATVKENISEIAAAGFSAIQVSPLSLCKEGGKQINGGWYWHYQPVDYEAFGNYQMGTLEDFKAMCQEAHKYGLKVIVDTVINHCTSDHGAIADTITNGFGGQAFHSHEAANWSEVDRYEETQYPLSGLYDWNTQRQDVQDYLKTFLMKCVEYGADGFRYDAAKLIELPDDTSKKYGNDFASDFWPTVLQNGASFQYGEVLQEGGKHEYDQGADAKSGYDDSDSSRLGAYQSLSFTAPDGQKQPFFTTASYYGFRVRDCVSGKSLAVDRIGDFLMPKGATAQQAVTWVESHDNYCNNSSYNELSDQQVIQGWAILSARAGGTPLFYSRPNNSSASNPWGDNIIGPAGSDMYKNPQVVAVNYFGNEMGDDAPEYLSNPMGNTSVLMIERGTRDFAGCVIVNSSDQDIVLNNVAVQAMADGTYRDAAYGGSFTVSGGKLSGTVKAGMVAVVYKSRISEASKVAFKADVELSEPSREFLTDTIQTTISLRSCASAAYKIDGGAWIPCQNGTTLTFGDTMSADDAVTLKVVGYDASGNTVAQTQSTYTKRVAHGQTIAYFDSRAYPNWDNIYVYVYSNSGNNGGWPGVKPEHLGNGLYRYVLPYTLESASGLHIMWTNNGTKTEGETELPMSPKTSMIYKADRTWVAYDGSLAGIGLSHSSGTYRESFLLTINAVDLAQASYILNDDAAVDCRNGATVTINIDALQAGQSITLTVSGTDSEGKAYSAQAVYTKSAQTESTKVYLDAALYPDWSAPYVYLWASGVKEYAPWPGIAMTDIGNGIYGFELPAELDGKTMNVIFSNNGSNQHPDVRSEPGTQMILTAQGQWTAYIPPQEEHPSPLPNDPTSPSEPTPPTETNPTGSPTPDPAPKQSLPIGLWLSIAGSICLAGGLVFFILRKRKK
jgi:alpha-amylase